MDNVNINCDLLNIVPNDCSIGIGHSATLQKMNITNNKIVATVELSYL